MTTTTVPVAGFEDVDGSGNVLLWDKARASQFFDALANDQQIPQDLITTGVIALSSGSTAGGQARRTNRFPAGRGIGGRKIP